MKRDLLSVPAEAAARTLLGWTLHRRLGNGTILVGRIVETEAYLGIEDEASHTYKGRRTDRNESMYGRPGTAYVYFTYGMHWCMNVACASEGDPQAVLLRAIEPLDGAKRMDELRLANPKAAAMLAEHKLGSGPARLCAAMGIDRASDGLDLLRPTKNGPALWLEPGDVLGDVLAGPRIGIDRVGEPWRTAALRFGVAGSRSLSRPFR